MKASLYGMLAAIAPAYMAGEVPQDTEGAYVVLQRTSRSPHHHLSGVPTLQEETYQIDCYGETEGEAADLADDIRHELDGASGELGAEFEHGRAWAAVEDVMDDFEPPRSGEERPKFRTVMTVRVFWQEGE